jgi:hypothetical protein
MGTARRDARRWPASNFPDSYLTANSRCELPILVLVADLLRGPIIESRVATSRIVPQFDVSHDVSTGVFAGRVLRAVDSFVLEHGEEGFSHCVGVS